MIEFSEKLKELGAEAAKRRESIGMTLETVYDRTRIRPEFLKGIEEGDYTDFPEIVYIKGFIRTYLKLIGAEDMQEDFIAQLDYNEKTGKTGSSFGKKKERKSEVGVKNILGSNISSLKGFKSASHLWLFIVLILALIGTGAYVFYAMDYSGIDLKNLKFLNFSGTGGIFSRQENPADDINAEEGVPVSLDIVAEEAEEPEPEPEPEKISPFLEIHAANDVWLSVAFGDAAPVYRRTLKRGEIMRWDLNAPARVVIGRPTAAQVILNGRDLGIVNSTARKAETYIYNPDGTYRKIK